MLLEFIQHSFPDVNLVMHLILQLCLSLVQYLMLIIEYFLALQRLALLIQLHVRVHKQFHPRLDIAHELILLPHVMPLVSSEKRACFTYVLLTWNTYETPRFGMLQAYL